MDVTGRRSPSNLSTTSDGHVRKDFTGDGRRPEQQDRRSRQGEGGQHGVPDVQIVELNSQSHKNRAQGTFILSIPCFILKCVIRIVENISS